MVLHFLRPACASPVFQRPHGQASGRSWAVSGAAAITCVVGDASLTIGPAGGRALTPAAAHGTGRPAQSGSGERRSGMSQSQKSKGKKSSTSPAAVSDAKGTQQLQPTDRRPLVTSRTSPLIRVRFRNPIRLSLSGGCSSSDARGTTASQEAGGGGCDRRRRSADSASMTSETGMASGAGPGPGTAPVGDDPGAAPQRPRPRHGAGDHGRPQSGAAHPPVPEARAAAGPLARLRPVRGRGLPARETAPDGDRFDRQRQQRRRQRPRRQAGATRATLRPASHPAGEDRDRADGARAVPQAEGRRGRTAGGLRATAGCRCRPVVGPRPAWLHWPTTVYTHLHPVLLMLLLVEFNKYIGTPAKAPIRKLAVSVLLPGDYLNICPTGLKDRQTDTRRRTDGHRTMLYTYR